MTHRRIVLLAAIVASAYAVRAQQPRRLPIIAGEMKLNYIVEVDGTVKSFGTATPEASYHGDGSPEGTRRETPTVVPGLTDIIDISTALQFTLALRRDGTVLAWGHNNGCELGVHDDHRRLSPIEIPAAGKAVQIGAGNAFGAALLADGTVRVWGASHLASPPERACTEIPKEVPELTGVKKIFVDSDHVFALKQDGTVWGWGLNTTGDLCDGTTINRRQPVQATGLTNVVDISPASPSAFVTADGSVYMCGENRDGSMATLADGRYTKPVKVPGIANAVEVKAAAATMARLRDGTLVGWGYGMFGGLGDGFVDKAVPKPHSPIGLGPVIAFYYASNEGFAVKADGTIWRWGFYLDDKNLWQTKPVPFYKVSLDGGR